MTIQGSRRPAAWFAVAFAAILAVFVLSALLLKQPSLLLFLVVLAPTQAAFVFMQARPISITFDGADIVYRVGGRETRTRRNAIATCALVGQGWVFSDSAGAQLFTLPVLRFTQTDVAAFCKQVGIKLDTPELKPVDQSRKDLRSATLARALSVGIALSFLFFAAFSIWLSINAQDALRRYQSAPVCTERSTSSTCRLQTQARVTSTELYGSHRASTNVHLTLIGTGAVYVANVNNSSAPKTGDLLDVEVWEGQVTRLGRVATSGNPQSDSNLDDSGVVLLIGLFAAIAFGFAVWYHVQVLSARGALRAAAIADSGSAGPVQAVQTNAPIDASGLPPCGIDHHPKEVFFAHWDRKTERTGVLIASVISAVVLAVLVLAMVYISVPVFGGIAALGLAWFGFSALGTWREWNVGGVFADDLHVGKITSSTWVGRLVRKVYERTSVLQCNVDGLLLTVVGVDGSTLFWTGALAPKDIDRFVAFVGRPTVIEEPPVQAEAIASAPVETPVGVLALRVRRAAGWMQTVGGLMLGLGVINLGRLPRLSPDVRVHLLELLAAMGLYGGTMAWLGWRLARGRPNSREAALIGGGVATAFLLVAEFVFYSGAADLPLYAILDVLALGTYGLVFYWVRDPNLSAGPSTSR